jgi:hypothetical protein
MTALRCIWMSCAAAGLAAAQPVFNPVDYGAKADGKTNDAAAIQKAIDACNRAAGGTVLLPSGNFLSGTIVLKSNVTLHISPGATLWGSRNIGDYGPVHLIYAEGAENIAIEGQGVINGNGDAFWEPNFRAKPKRPMQLIELVGCRNVHIRDIRIRNAPAWGIHPWNCDGVYIRGISMITDMRGPNTDGIDPDSSRDVFISDSYIEGGDDAICLKTTRRSDGKPVPACERVTATNNVLISDDSAIKLGTASYGDFRDCTFSNTVISGTRYGIAMYIKDGANVERIQFSNITIDTSIAHYNQTTGSNRTWIEYPIFLDLEKRSEQSVLSRIRDVVFSDIQIQGKGRVLVEGLPERPLENLSFRNISVRVTGFEPIEKQTKPRGVANIRPTTPETDYANVPAAMIFANIRGLNLRDLRVIWEAPGGEAPARHALYASRVQDLTLDGFAGSPAGTALAAIGLDSVRNAFIAAVRLSSGTPVFIGTHDVAEADLILTNNDLKPGTVSVKPDAAHIHLR